MKKINPLALLLCLIATAQVFGERKINLFTAFDIGRVEDGFDMQNKFDLGGTVLNRTYVDVGMTDQLDENFLINVGVGGIFWKAVAYGPDGADEKVIKFGPGISSAYMRWTPIPDLSLDFGYFPYKYNEAAKNLGEYLFRTEAYPTIIYTGGWVWMNDVQYRTVGVKLSWNLAGGMFKQDIGLFGEYFNSPIYDITPAYIATLKPLGGLTFGGAVSLHRFITPTRGTKKELTKSWEYYKDFFFPAVKTKAQFYIDFDTLAGKIKYDVEYDVGGRASAADTLAARDRFWTQDSVAMIADHGITSAAAIPLGDTITTAGRDSLYESRLKDDIGDPAYFGHAKNASRGYTEANPSKVSFDLAAIKLVAFFELNFNRLLGLDAEKVGEFNIYGEVAQLGLKNYPIFYTDMAQRRPIMLGASIPTMGLLQHLSFEGEYLKNPTIQSLRSTYDILELLPDKDFRYKTFARDDIKWTVHAARNITKNISLHVQVANDHLRLKNFQAKPEYIPATSTPEHWYWLTRIQWYL